VLAAARQAFPPGNPQGVVAHGIDISRRAGRSQGYYSLVLYVACKARRPATAIKPVPFSHNGKAYAAVPDVIGVGGEPLAAQGTAGQFSGLHPGARIEARVSKTGYSNGGVACLLTTGTRPTHLLTAGHLFNPMFNRSEVLAAADEGEERVVVGSLTGNLLDQAPMTTGYHLDAALVELNAAGRNMAEESDRWSSPRLAGQVAQDELQGNWVQSFRPTTGGYSMETKALAGVFTANLKSGARPLNFSVTDVIKTRSTISREGDSGTIMFTLGDDCLAGGICSGCLGAEGSLFEPLDRALNALQSTLDADLNIWP